MAGFMLIVHPGAGTWAIVMILPIWIIAHCVSRLSHLQYMKMHFGTTYYYISMILNILGLIVGFLLVFRAEDHDFFHGSTCGCLSDP